MQNKLCFDDFTITQQIADYIRIMQMEFFLELSQCSLYYQFNYVFNEHQFHLNCKLQVTKFAIRFMHVNGTLMMRGTLKMNQNLGWSQQPADIRARIHVSITNQWIRVTLKINCDIESWMAWMNYEQKYINFHQHLHGISSRDLYRSSRHAWNST